MFSPRILRFNFSAPFQLPCRLLVFASIYLTIGSYHPFCVFGMPESYPIRCGLNGGYPLGRRVPASSYTTLLGLV